MKRKTGIAVLAMVSAVSLLFGGCGSKETAGKETKTYDISKEYAQAVEQLDNCILDEETYASLQEELTAYEKSVKALSKKEAKACREVIEEVSAYYQASADLLKEKIDQIGTVYPTEEDFYDEAFRSSTTPLAKELNELMHAGKYKAAAVKLNEITAAYTAYVEGKGITVSADVTVDTTRSVTVRSSAGRGNASSGSQNNSGTGNTAGGSQTSGNSQTAGSHQTSGSNQAAGSGTTASGGRTITCGQCGKAVPIDEVQNHRCSAASGSGGHSGSASNTTPSQTYTTTCDKCGMTITGVVGDDKCQQHAKECGDAMAAAFEYHTEVQRAYTAARNAALDSGQPWNWSMRDWCAANGYDVEKYNADARKYGWGTM